MKDIPEKENYTYILRCADGTYYTGWTKDLEKRVRDHSAGDLGIAAYMLKAAMESAWLNVLINVASLKDKAYAQESYDTGKKMLDHAIPIVDDCCARAQKLIEEKI